jgi:uncharacterized protein YecT (DUF1311 family)
MRIVSVCLLIFAANAAAAASFDCNKARSVSEKLICSTPYLSALDEELFPIYKSAKRTITDWPETFEGGFSPSQWFKSSGRDAWRWREANCYDVACLEVWFTERRALLSWIATAKDRLGDHGLGFIGSLPEGDVLISYRMVTHNRNVIYRKSTNTYDSVINGDLSIVDHPTAPILVQQSKGYLNGGGAFWIDFRIDGNGEIHEIIRPKNWATCYTRVEFVALTSFTKNDLSRVTGNSICVTR